MDEELDENGQRLAEAMAKVREFVLQQVRDGQQADAHSFALTLIATDLGLQLTHGRNPLGVVRTVLQGVIAAASNSESNEQIEAVARPEIMPAHDAETVPAGAVIH